MNTVRQLTRILVITFIIIQPTFAIDSEEQFIQSTVKLDTLIGPLPALVKNKKYPYLVPSNIEVPPDKTVTIEPGVVFLFRNFSGLHVRGKLIARGTEQEPIVFTSEYDKKYNPRSNRDANPFDWDGIYMTVDALGTQLSQCVISYSVYGISSETKFIRLDPIMVKENGKSIISIENIEYPMTDTTFNYILDKSAAIKDGIPIDFIKDPISKKRITYRILSSTLIAGGLGTVIYYGIECKQSINHLDRISQTDFENLNQNNSSEWQKANKKVISNIILCSTGALITILGIVGFSWTFTF